VVQIYRSSKIKYITKRQALLFVARRASPRSVRRVRVRPRPPHSLFSFFSSSQSRPSGPVGRESRAVCVVSRATRARGSCPDVLLRVLRVACYGVMACSRFDGDYTGNAHTRARVCAPLARGVASLARRERGRGRAEAEKRQERRAGRKETHNSASARG